MRGLAVFEPLRYELSDDQVKGRSQVAIKLLLGAAVVASLISAPVMSAPIAGSSAVMNPAASLSLESGAGVRKSSSSKKHDNLFGAPIFILVIAGAAVAVGIAAAATGGFSSGNSSSN